MEKKHTIGNVTAGFMIAVALLMDALQGLFTLLVILIPLSWFVTFLSLIIFFLWFALMGVKYTGSAGGRKLLTMLAMSIAELVPVVNALPATTAGVIGVIVQTRIEDARRNMGGKVPTSTAAAYARMRRAQQSRARQDAAREEREETQLARHAANDNSPENERLVA